MTLCFQGQFLKQKCIYNTKGTIKNAYNSERKKKRIVTKQNITKDQKKRKELNRDIETQTLVMKCGLYVASVQVMYSLNKRHNPHNPN